jgi:copper chaperone
MTKMILGVFVQCQFCDFLTTSLGMKLMTWQLTIPNMACGACVTNITKAVQSLDAQAALTADLASKQVSIDTTQSRESIAQVITQAGYSVQS